MMPPDMRELNQMRSQSSMILTLSRWCTLDWKLSTAFVCITWFMLDGEDYIKCHLR